MKIQILVLSFTLLFACGTSENYTQSILDHRIQIDNFMNDSSESPFNSSSVNYPGLDYFEPSAQYVIEATYQPFGNRKVKQLATSDGKQESYEEYGIAYFILDGVQNQLVVLQSVASTSDDLFIPFIDATSGESTYGGGRYLNVTLSDSETIELDFNKAYNPYCAYVAAYSCPLPPKSNILSISILAGEKDF